MTTVYFPADHTASEWREMARNSRQRSVDSFDRSDTDGFVSQWASDTMASLYDMCADIADNGNKFEFDAPFIDGVPVDDWAWCKTRYGSTVRIGRGDDVQWFNPSGARKGAKRLANDTAKGVVWGTLSSEAVVMMGGGGTGLAGALTVRPIAKPRHGAEKTVVATVSDRYEIDHS